MVAADARRRRRRCACIRRWPGRSPAASAGRSRSRAFGVPRHQPGPPETPTDTDYVNVLRVPDRRTIADKRDYALLRVLGDCGLRSAELRGLRARDLRRPRANARHHRLYVHDKGGRERGPGPRGVQQALEDWLKVHLLARGVGLLDEQPLFVRLGRHGDQQPLPLSAVARTARPPPLPRRWRARPARAPARAPRLLGDGPARGRRRRPRGLRAARARRPAHDRPYAPRPERVDEIAEVLDRRHEAARRAGWGRRTGHGRLPLVATRMRRRLP